MSNLRAIRERNLDALLGIVETGMLVAGPDLRIRAINRRAEHLLGLERAAALGLTCREVLGPDLCRDGCAFRRTLLDRKSHPSWGVRIRTRKGEERDLVLGTAYLDAPDPDDVAVAVSLRDVTDAERLRRALQDPWSFHGLVCASRKMKEVVSLVREVAPYDATVLILGESGTGKELVARAIHEESPRRGRPFVTVNCSAYPEGLLESELFGHVRGAFTGAVSERKGRFAAAHGGTVFLDEIGEIQPTVQVKLLRVLQEREIERVGDQQPTPVDIRVIAATNRDLKQEVARRRFREDLFYRLNVLTLSLPPLRERREDVPALTEHFLRTLGERTHKVLTGICDDALETLLRHDWPGNVRELENAIEHAVVRARGPVLMLRDLPAELRDALAGRTPRTGDESWEGRIDRALEATGGRIGRAATMLGIHRTTLWRHLRRRGSSPWTRPAIGRDDAVP